jgi:hypothetical protein
MVEAPEVVASVLEPFRSSLKKPEVANRSM